MSVRVNFEIGHEASLRTKRTPEGFTHDWEVFVRGCDNAAIHYYVEKVVFYLHETFPKPKRVVKEPPYVVKESGYAGFNLPIEIYLRNREEPKKIRFNYDLNLQNTGPPVYKIRKEKYVFTSPTDDFKHKLLKGGGVIVSSSFQDIGENHTISEDKMQMTSKPKLSGTEMPKKYKMKIEDMRMSDSFQDLFGTPIKKPPEPKLPPKDLKNTSIKSDKGTEKEKSKSKHSPHKDKDRDKQKEKGDFERKNRDEKKKDKERVKDRERSKEKSSKRDKSPRPRSASPKRISSPKRPVSPTLKLKEKEEKRLDLMNKEKDKRMSEEKSEKKSKKEKRDKDKEHKDKHKDRDSQKISEHKMKELKPNREIIKEKDPSPHPPKIEKKDKPKEGSKDMEKERKDCEAKSEEKPKHKHKKKDKEKREKKDDKEKSHKSEKKLDKAPTPVKYHENIKETLKESDKIQFSPKNEPLSATVENKTKDKSQKPLNTLFSEIIDNDSSNSSLSSHEQSPSIEIQNEKTETAKKEPVFDQKKNKSDLGEKVKIKKEKVKKNKDKKSEKDGDKKRKRKSDIPEDEAPADKVPKEETNVDQVNSDQEQATSMSPIRETNKENQENPEDYMQILKDLQHKIMTLQDNTELQKVVQLIAETGRFEVSARTFDFDLCLLERSTVRQLQEFFSNTS